jgi:hypothetical protein
MEIREGGNFVLEFLGKYKAIFETTSRYQADGWALAMALTKGEKSRDTVLEPWRTMCTVYLHFLFHVQFLQTV